jgi:hypothetical protein
MYSNEQTVQAFIRHKIGRISSMLSHTMASVSPLPAAAGGELAGLVGVGDPGSSSATSPARTVSPPVYVPPLGSASGPPSRAPPAPPVFESTPPPPPPLQDAQAVPGAHPPPAHPPRTLGATAQGAGLLASFMPVPAPAEPGAASAGVEEVVPSTLSPDLAALLQTSVRELTASFKAQAAPPPRFQFYAGEGRGEPQAERPAPGVITGTFVIP